MKIYSTLLAILITSSLFAQQKPELKQGKTKVQSTGMKFPDLGEFDLSVDNSYQNVKGIGLKLNLAEAQFSTTNISPIGGRAGLTYFANEGINVYAGVYSMYGDILVNRPPFNDEFRRTDNLGSVNKIKSERGFEMSASYFIPIGSPMRYKADRIMVSKTKGNVTFNWLANVECERHLAVAPLVGFEKGRKQYQFTGSGTLMLDPVGDQFDGGTVVKESAFLDQSSMQDYTNLKLGAMVQLSDFLQVDAGVHGKRKDFSFIRAGVALLLSMNNTFDDVYGSTFYQDPDQSAGAQAYPGQTSEVYILDRYSIDGVNEKSNTGAEIFVEYEGLIGPGLKFFVRSNPGLKAFPSYDIGGAIVVTIGKF